MTDCIDFLGCGAVIAGGVRSTSRAWFVLKMAVARIAHMKHVGFNAPPCSLGGGL